MDGTHKHAIYAPRWFMAPCLVHIAPLLIYLPSLKSQHLTGVYLSRHVRLLEARLVWNAHVFFSVCVCPRAPSVPSSACERHDVWHDKRWPSLRALHPTPVMASGTRVSVVMVTAVIDKCCIPRRQICEKHFLLLSELFPSVLWDFRDRIFFYISLNVRFYF